MTAQVETAKPDLLPGMQFDSRLGLHVQTMIARQLVTHTALAATRSFPTCSFDPMSGNTMLGINLAIAEVGGYKCDHRHIDETVSFMLTSEGFSEFRQADEGEPHRVDWVTGDMVVIPANAWHRHVNTGEVPLRMISFRSTPVMYGLLFAGEKSRTIFNQGIRFNERFDDEGTYFTAEEVLAPGRVAANFIPQVASRSLPDDDPAYGRGVAIEAFAMGRQCITDLALAQIRAGGSMHAHRPLAEEAFLVLSGSGTTDVWTENGPRVALNWSEGDLVSAPLGAWRRHAADDGSDVRILLARCTALERLVGLADQGAAWRLDSGLPDRLGALVDAGIATAESR